MGFNRFLTMVVFLFEATVAAVKVAFEYFSGAEETG